MHARGSGVQGRRARWSLGKQRTNERTKQNEQSGQGVTRYGAPMEVHDSSIQVHTWHAGRQSIHDDCWQTIHGMGRSDGQDYLSTPPEESVVVVDHRQ